MRNFRIETLNRHLDTDRYEHIGNGIYKKINLKTHKHPDHPYCVTLSWIVEEGEDYQNPSEDLLEEFDTLLDYHHQDEQPFDRSYDPDTRQQESFMGSLENIQRIAGLIAKQVYMRFHLQDRQWMYSIEIEDANQPRKFAGQSIPPSDDYEDDEDEYFEQRQLATILKPKWLVNLGSGKSNTWR